MKRVIVTADDFGRSRQVNRAVIQSHQNGILTCASLMVSGEAADEAVHLAKMNPTLKVGLHLVLVDGFSVLSPEEIPDLVDAQRRFADQPAVAGVGYFFSSRIKRQVAKECEAQIQKFLSTGLTLDHLNSHHHLHIHPTIANIVTGLARKHTIPAVRLPYQGLRTLTGPTTCMAAMMLPWVLYLKICLLKAGIKHNREIFGLYETGTMTESAWLGLIAKLKPGVTEVFCHPADVPAADDPEQGPADRGHEEFKALCSQQVRRRFEEENVILTGFSNIGGV